MDSAVSYQPSEFLPAPISHNHKVYIIVTANCLRLLTYTVLRRKWRNRLRGPLIWPTQKWRGASMGHNNNSCLLRTQTLHAIAPVITTLSSTATVIFQGGAKNFSVTGFCLSMFVGNLTAREVCSRRLIGSSPRFFVTVFSSKFHSQFSNTATRNIWMLHQIRLPVDVITPRLGYDASSC